MFKTLIILLLVITTFLPLTAIEAVEVKDLYQASVTINSRNNADKAIALKKALATVMIKVGGKRSILENEIIKGSLNDYQLYLNQYRYHYNTNPAIKSIKEKQNQTQTEPLLLIASFNEDKINKLFQQANLAIWGSLRPQVLLWLVNEDGLQRTITSNSTDSTLPAMVTDFSEQRGLPIMMPLMDLTDATQITLSDIWGRFEQPVLNASSRYFAEAIVIMRISNSSLLAYEQESEDESSNCGALCTQTNLKEQSYILDWSVLGWNLGDSQKNFSQQYQGSERKKLLQQGLTDITQLIYQYYALSTTSKNSFTIDVANVSSLTTYVEIVDFLTNLSAVKSVTLLSAEGASRRFSLELLGSSDAFVASLTLNKQLKEVIDPLAKFNETPFNNDADEIAVPIFYWDN